MKRIKHRRRHLRISNPIGFSLFLAGCLLAVGILGGIVCLCIGYGDQAVAWIKDSILGVSEEIEAEANATFTPIPTNTPIPTDAEVQTPEVGTPAPPTITPEPLVTESPAPDGVVERDPNAPLYGFVIGLDPTRDTDSKYPDECEYNLAFAKELKAYLEAKGATVVLTREDNDKSYSNTKRAATLKEADCDIALRLMCNHIAAKTSGCYVQSRKKHMDYAQLLIDHYSELTGIPKQAGKDDGTQSKNDAVCDELDCPGVMLILGNWDNKTERSNLQDDLFRQNMIEAIYQTFLSELTEN